MSADPPINDDPILRRVAQARPPIAEDDLSPQGWRAQAIAERVRRSEPPTRSAPSPSRWRRPRWALPRVGLVLAPVIAVIVLLLSGTLSGPDGSGTQSAAAAVIAATKDALHPSPGTVFVEDQAVSGAGVHGHPYTMHQVLETPSRGPQNELTSGLVTTRRDPVGAVSFVGGTQEIYVPSSNTIYASSIWGPYLHPGPRPGTYVYRPAAGAVVGNTRPILVTARQRQLLLSGQDCIRTTGKLLPNGKVEILPPKVLPPLRGSAELAQTLQQEIANRQLHLVGRTRIDGREAIELAGRTTDATAPGVRIYFDPRTHLPIAEIDNVGTRHQTETRLRLRKLPLTATSRRLLSLQAMYPTARVDHSHADYLRAAHGLQVYNQ